jgi:hypothetical protein
VAVRAGRAYVEREGFAGELKVEKLKLESFSSEFQFQFKV